jgi:hypothetical protein
MRKGVIDVHMYNESVHELMLGQVSILAGIVLSLCVTSICRLRIVAAHRDARQAARIVSRLR